MTTVPTGFRPAGRGGAGVRRMTRASAGSGLLAAAALVCGLAAGCGQAPPPESLAASGVLGCATSAAWGQVTSVTPGADGLHVVLRVERWVVPGQKTDTVAFVADDPAREVGAPAWTVGDRGLLVLLPATPPSLRGEAAGRSVEQAWRDAGARRLDDCPA